MSYAKIAAQNAAPEERQAHPDTSLLTTPADVAQGPTSPQGAPEDLAAAEKAHGASTVAAWSRGPGPLLVRPG